MAKTKFEEAFEKMTAEQRKKVGEEISNMMGMPLPRTNPKKEHKKNNV